ncbi:hypothetical protein EWM64_g7719 [Hericium alpestre]|uniref:acireductone dioxygenase (Fe(2+)-requiring) n=1 Tax=Hericium alpestre TaxID=135208 RepID=A0A4Y9ZQI3_9AGAM|nr:hypothetical protein EWM64_g7719 [Hericium alpestre]
MRAYYFDNLTGDQCALHDSGRAVSEEHLSALGVLHWKIIPIDEAGNWQGEIDSVAKEKSYKNREVINITKEGLGDAYESKLKMFYEEQCLHITEHPPDNWIRIHVTPGDLLVVPAGIYHRFGLDELNRIRTMRLFKVRLMFSS